MCRATDGQEFRQPVQHAEYECLKDGHSVEAGEVSFVGTPLGRGRASVYS
jgi:hypothetical protein